MNISLNQIQGRVPIGVLSIQGDLDASNFQELIAKAKEVYDTGTRHILLDLSNTPFMSSSGLVALHSAALLLQGKQPPDPEYGWTTVHAVSHVADAGHSVTQHVKLLNPQPKVRRTLEKAGLNEFFEIHTDLATAIASF
jgi:anti-anti-sigma regulatory factor